MWIFLSIVSALLLGFYDVAKKKAIGSNSLLWVLAVSTIFSTLLMLTFASEGPLRSHLLVAAKAVLVSASWISGLAAMRLMPLSTLSTLKASRPVFVVLLSCILFSERLSALQWAGVAVVFAALYLLSRASAKEGIRFTHSRGVAYAAVAILTGVFSALYDKYLLRSLEPLFVQFWADLYISVIMVLCLCVQALRGREGRLRWSWTLPLIAVLITGADACYFFALKADGALLSVISLVRRASVAVTFLCSALFFGEKRLREKGFSLALLLSGIAILCVCS